MEHFNRSNNPTANGAQLPGQHPVTHSGQPNNKKPNMANVIKIVAVVVVTLVVLVGILAVLYNATRGIKSEIKTDRYQAVFLNSADGQVYFGKLSVMNKDYYKLTDIYYVRVEQVQPDPKEQPQQNISLAKLGNEIHGPEDTMYIRNEHVMFWENLKEDGQVVKAIREYQQNPDKNNQSQPQQDQNNQ
ncbi:MAG: hypothetical protein MUF85_03805 [Patescibacteria group bacterium]|jgi:hypothetical protein|nr:hypothetical protein [Patescibacteria group bacterium]